MPRRDNVLQLRRSAPTILPSLLLCDFGNLEREVRRLEQAGVAGLHLDVMDGVFVPNLTYGMPIVEAVRRLTDLPLDVHLMISEPQRYFEQFYAAGADSITFHVEAVEDPRAALTQLRELGAAAGLALNPSTPADRVEACLDACDLVLVMSVEAGFGGQSFNESALPRLKRFRELAGDDVLLEVDGGVGPSTIGSCAKAGAELFVVGSAIFRHDDYTSAVGELSDRACSAINK
ncbi:MAG: ribulose-phosphate 3-epimerase [Pirellulaceae bacterium]